MRVLTREELPWLYYPENDSVRIINAHNFPPSGSGYLLDDYAGAVAAYSLRKLRAAYAGSCIRVRRSSDSTETDIGFSGDSLDTASLLTFCGAGSGFVKTWYDQSASAANLTQSVAGDQPAIVTSGSLNTLSSVPAIRFDGSNDVLTAGTTSWFDSQWSVFSAAYSSTDENLAGVWEQRFSDTLVDARIVGYFDTRTSVKRHSNYAPDRTARLVDLLSKLGTSAWYGLTSITDASNMQGFVDGVSQGSTAIGGTASGGKFFLGWQSAGGLYLNGGISECVVYDSDQSASRSGIESNIFAHHGIS